MKRKIITLRILFVLALLSVAGNYAFAESFVLQGTVVDAEKHPIELASVAVVKQKVMKMTSSLGKLDLTLRSSDSVVVCISPVGPQTRNRVSQSPRGTSNVGVTL